MNSHAGAKTVTTGLKDILLFPGKMFNRFLLWVIVCENVETRRSGYIQSECKDSICSTIIFIFNVLFMKYHSANYNTAM